jgi:hypothetical protein
MPKRQVTAKKTVTFKELRPARQLTINQSRLENFLAGDRK